MGARLRGTRPAGRGILLGALLLALVPACGGDAGGGASGVELAVTCTPTPPRVGPTAFALSLTDADGAPLEGAAVEVEGTMSHAGMVPEFGTASEVAPGRYEVELELTMGGDWILIVDVATADGRSFELIHDLRGVGSGGGG